MTIRVLFLNGQILSSGVVTQDDEDTADYAFDVADDMEMWRLSIDDDGNLVTAYDGEDRETALASLLADQQAQEALDNPSDAE